MMPGVTFSGGGEGDGREVGEVEIEHQEGGGCRKGCGVLGWRGLSTQHH